MDVAIPANNRGKHSVGLIYWLLAREVLKMRGTIPADQPWEEPVDLFFFRDAEEMAQIEETMKRQAEQVQEQQFVEETPAYGGVPEMMPQQEMSEFGAMGTAGFMPPAELANFAAPPAAPQFGATDGYNAQDWSGTQDWSGAQ